MSVRFWTAATQGNEVAAFGRTGGLVIPKPTARAKAVIALHFITPVQDAGALMEPVWFYGWRVIEGT